MLKLSPRANVVLYKIIKKCVNKLGQRLRDPPHTHPTGVLLDSSQTGVACQARPRDFEKGYSDVHNQLGFLG